MPAVVVAVAAAAAAAGTAAALSGPLIAAGFVTAAGALSAGGAFIAGLAGAVVATGVSFAASSVLGLNRPPSSSRPSTAQDRRQMIRSAIAPRQVVYGRARVSGPMVYASSSGPDQRYLHLIVPVTGHVIAGYDAVWINDDRIPLADIAADGYVRDNRFSRPWSGDLGATGAYTTPAGEVRRSLARVKFYDGTQTFADPQLLAESEDGWSADHQLRGIAYVYASLEYDREVFPNGIQSLGAEIRGKNDLLDPRTNAVGYSENVALIVLDYLRSADGLACEPDELDLPFFATAANICDEPVQIDAAGTTQPRHHGGGAFTLDAAPIEVMEQMKAACAGELVYVQGRYRLHVGAYSAPTDTLTASDLAGPVALEAGTPRRERFNAVRGTFIEPVRAWQASEFPPVTDAAFAAADGETIFRDIELPFVSNGIRAQRLARLALRRAREDLTLRVSVRYAGLRYAVWQMLSVTLSDFGFVSKPFRVTAWAFDPASGLVTLTLREESAASYAWNWDEANALGAAPNTALVSPFGIPAPTGLAFREELFVAQNGAGVRTRAVFDWVPPAHPFVIGYDVEVRAASVPTWRAVTGAQTEPRAVVDDLADGLYFVRIRGRSTVAAGAWAELQFRIGALAAQPPTAITGLAVQSIGGFAFLRWDRHPDLDVRVGGRIEFRHTPDTVSPTWIGSTGIGEAQPGDSTFAVLPLKPGTYLAKAVDAGGRYSVTEALVGAAQASALAFASVATLTEHPGFSGAKSGAVVASGKLRLNTAGNVDAVAVWDSIVNFDLLGGVLSEGNYVFSGGIDLGSVRSVRLTGRIAAIVVNTLDVFDARTQPVDEWPAWDGTAGGEANAWVEVRETPDNPSSSPVWSDWRRLDASEFRARGFQFRAQLRSSDATFNIDISELSVTAEEVI